MSSLLHHHDRVSTTLWRLGRGLSFSLFANPFAFIAAALALGVLFHICRALLWGPGHDHALTAEDLLACGACALTLILVVLLAGSHITLAFLIGWRNSRGARR